MQTFFRRAMMAAMLASALPSFAHDAATPAPAGGLSVGGAIENALALIAGKDLNSGPRHVKWLQSIEVRQIVE